MREFGDVPIVACSAIGVDLGIDDKYHTFKKENELEDAEEFGVYGDDIDLGDMEEPWKRLSREGNHRDSNHIKENRKSNVSKLLQTVIQVHDAWSRRLVIIPQ